jgi:hypothetical protein
LREAQKTVCAKRKKTVSGTKGGFGLAQPFINQILCYKEKKTFTTGSQTHISSSKMATLDEQLTYIQLKIDKVEVEIESSTNPNEKKQLREEKRQLREEKRQLREKEHQLREKEHQLREEKLIVLRREKISRK